MLPVFDNLDLRRAESVAATFRAGADANRTAPCRRGSIDVIDLTPGIGPSGRLVATGDLHDNPVHLGRILQAAGLDDPARPPAERAHLTLHELIHGENPTNDLDFSFRTLCRAAHLKATFPDLVHTLLANHELSQIVGAGVMKDGVDCVQAFNDAVDHTFGDYAAAVHDAIKDFIRSMPLALRVKGGTWTDGTPGDILCAHSLPAPELMDRFDPSILSRDLEEGDYTPRRGTAHLMAWGRGHTPAFEAEIVHLLGINRFILGHEHAPSGYRFITPSILVVNSDHSNGTFAIVDSGNMGFASLARWRPSR